MRRIPMSPPRVLVTEDDEDTRELIELLLTSEGFEVVTTDVPAKALGLAITEQFDLFILDNWMSDSSGLDLCRSLRTFDTKTPILFYSGAALDSDKKDALECGAQAYIVKPGNLDELVAEAARLVRDRES